MSYCLNPQCHSPENSDKSQFCISCGTKLWLGDRYRIVRPLTEKGMGKTFLGVDETDPNKNFCVIKQVNYNFDKNNPQQGKLDFQKEALKLQELGNHPQIPKLLAYFIPEPQHNYGNLPILVQEYIDGEPINREIFEEKKIIELLESILPLLQFIHEKGIIHRDINPDNILRQKNTQELILVDFSTAKVTTKTALAKTGTVIGSAAYTAPEQLRGKADFSSDIYSLGITCINLLTGMHPFDLFSSLDGIWVWKDYLPEPINQELYQIINKMISDTLAKRFSSVKELLEALVNTQQIPPSFLNIPQQISVTPLQLKENSLTPGWKCINTLTGHLNSIHTLTFNEDGKILVSGGADQTIKLWDLKTNQLLHTLKGHQSIIETVIFTPDHQFLISGSWDYTIRIWDYKNQVEINQFKEHSGWINCLTISPDGKTLISGGADKTIKVWQLPEGIIKHNIKLESNYIKSLAFSPFGKLFATGNNQGLIQLWDLEKAEEKIRLSGHEKAVNSLTFSPSGQLLFSGSADHLIKVWNLSTGKILNTFCGHSGEINSIAINNKGNLLISGSGDKTITVWHSSRGELLETLFDHSGGIKAIAIHPEKMMFASGSQDKSIKIWQFR
jgi:serine/threonine protein kinase